MQSHRAQDGGASGPATPASAAVAGQRVTCFEGDPASTAVATICIDTDSRRIGANPRNLIDRYCAAAEKHTGRPAIASNSRITTSGINGTNMRISGCATVATDPSVGGGLQTDPS